MDVYQPNAPDRRTLQTCFIYAILGKKFGNSDSEYCNEDAIGDLMKATKHKKYSMDNVEQQMDKDINKWFKEVDLQIEPLYS